MRTAILVAGAIVAGCATDFRGSRHDGARAELRDDAGRIVAQADVQQTDGGLRVRLQAWGVSPGFHGVHVHAAGRCDPPGFDGAGPHWSPNGRQHGRDNPQGPHFGDLPNLTVGRDGRGRLDYSIAGAALRGPGGMLDGDGAAVVIHANADDLRTDPSGNSGARIACGVLG